VRFTLSRYAPVEPGAWSFVANEYGCPAVQGEEGTRLRFNLSHTDGMAVVAVALGADVGVDVEDSQRPGEMVNLADNYFSRSEAAALRALPVERQKERFFEYWTLKEAYIKARGMGLAIPLDQFSFELMPGQYPRISFDARLRDEPEAWQFRQHRPSARHQVALAVQRPRERPLQVRYQRLVPLGREEAPLFVKEG
jgi:4'-phosphopantetheinyl transferase